MTFASFLTQEMIFYLYKKFVYSSLQNLIYVCGMGIFHCRHSLLHISFQFPIPSLPTTIVISALYDDRDDLLPVMVNGIYSKYHHYRSQEKASKMARCMFVRIRITIHSTAKKKLTKGIGVP